MRICTVVGARPQFIKASVVSRALAAEGIEEDLVHTGQHYDDEMSKIFFDELGLSAPRVNLGVGSGSHAIQTGRIMVALEEFLGNVARYDAVLVYGDTNSTLAAALVGAKLHVPVVHVEAGLRSFNARMPEEVNRIIADRLSQLLFCPTPTAVRNLEIEGVVDGVFLVGDVMLEMQSLNLQLVDTEESRRLANLDHRGYYVCTIHRQENVTNLDTLSSIMEGLSSLSLPVILPVHPRTQVQLSKLTFGDSIRLIPPISYRSMIALLSESAGLVTDSGGLQKEAYWLGTPCLTIRRETEWPETLEGGWNQLVGAVPHLIASGFDNLPTARRNSFGQAPEASPSALISRYLKGFIHGHDQD